MLLGTTFDSLAFARPTRWGSLGVSAPRLGTGSIEGRAADRGAAGVFEAAYAAYAVSGAGRLPFAVVGATVKLLRGEIGPRAAQTVAADLGARKALPGWPLSVGLGVRNLGPGLRFISQRDALRLTLSAGAAWRLAGVLGLAADVRDEPYDRRTTLAFGTEYDVLGALPLRAGCGLKSFARQAGRGRWPASPQSSAFGHRRPAARMNCEIIFAVPLPRDMAV